MPLILPSQRVIRPNPLAYPAGAVPGFDPSHPAANKLVVSALAQGRSFVNLATGIPLAVSGTGASSLTDGAIGRSTYFSGVQTCSIVGSNAVTQNRTFAAILRPIAPGAGYAGIVNIYDGVGDEGLYLHNNVFICYAGQDNSSSITLTNNVPYFIAVSGDASNFYYVVKNLNTGAVQTATVGVFSNAFSRPDSFIYVGEDGVNNASQSYVAAASYSNSSLSMQQLLQWAQSPWDFWYPRRTIQYTTPATTTTTTGGARIRQRWNRSPLAYPAGAVPGIDRSHPAAPGLFGFISPNSGRPFSLAGKGPFGKADIDGTYSFKIDEHLGPCFQTGGAGNDFIFNSVPILPTTAAGMGFTYASIVKPLDVANTTVFISFSDPEIAADGLYQGLIGGKFGIRLASTVTFDSGITATNGIPYFYAVSLIYRGSSLWDHNHVVLRLDTGQLTAVSVTGTANGAYTTGQPAFRFGGSLTFGAQCIVGHSMTGTTILNMEQLVQFARDPWSFWYPNKTINLASSAASAGASFLPVWAYRYNLPVLGTGTF